MFNSRVQFVQLIIRTVSCPLYCNLNDVYFDVFSSLLQDLSTSSSELILSGDLIMQKYYFKSHVRWQQQIQELTLFANNRLACTLQAFNKLRHWVCKLKFILQACMQSPIEFDISSSNFTSIKIDILR